MCGGTVAEGSGVRNDHLSFVHYSSFTNCLRCVLVCSLSDSIAWYIHSKISSHVRNKIALGSGNNCK